MNLKINKRKLLWSLSSTVDLVGITELSHGKRVAYIAREIFRELEGFPYSETDVITAALLHDCGVSSTDVHEHLAKEMEWVDADFHCLRGEELLNDQPDYSHLAKAIKYHHTRWSHLGSTKDEKLGNLIFIADRIDILAITTPNDILIDKDIISEQISMFSNTLFKPEYVEAFFRASKRDIFWLTWSHDDLEKEFSDWINDEESSDVTFKELRTLFSLFSSCVDGKSSYTSSHSLGVASLSAFIGYSMGMEDETISKLELAGLLHDLGKLKVPDYILEKKGVLDLGEYQIMRHHSFDSYRILSEIEGLEDIAKWAFQHHEKLNGKGYPIGLTDKELATESRIIMVSDIFQALAQDRPYRKGLNIFEILDILDDMASNYEIDGDIISVIKKYPQECMASALAV